MRQVQYAVIAFLALLLAACSSLIGSQNMDDRAVVTFRLAADQVLTLDLRKATGEALYFDQEHNLTSHGERHLSLHRNSPEITLTLQPGTYVVTVSSANQRPSSSIHVFHQGANEVIAVASSETALPDPGHEDNWASTFVTVSGLPASIDAVQRQLRFQDLSTLVMGTHAETLFLNELTGEPGSADQFWQQVSQESWVTVEGRMSNGEFLADLIFMFSDEPGIGVPDFMEASTQVVVTGDLSSLDASHQKLTVHDITLDYHFVASSLFELDYALLSASAFWQQVKDDFAIVMVGEALDDTFKVYYVHALSGTVIAPPSPELVVIEGSVSSFDAGSRFLQLDGFSDITVTVNENTFYLSEKHDSGELSADAFWQRLSAESYLIVHGELSNPDSGSLLAYEIIELSDIPVPPPYAQESEVLSVAVDAKQFDLATGETVVATNSTLYSSTRYGELSADAFWAGLEPGMNVSVYGDFDGVILQAFGIHLHDVDGPIDALEGMVASIDALTGTIVLDQNSLGFALSVTTTEATAFWILDGDAFMQVPREDFFDTLALEDLIFAEGVLDATGSTLEAFRVERFSYEPNPYVYLEGYVSAFDAALEWLEVDSFVGERISTTSETQYYNETRGDMSAADFWAQLKNGDFVMIEARYRDDISSEARVVADYIYLIGEYTEPVYFEGAVAEFDQVAQQLYLDNVDRPIHGTAETEYFNAEGFPVSAEDFWRDIAIGDLIWVQGFEEDGQVFAQLIAHFYVVPEPWSLEAAVLDIDVAHQRVVLEGYEDLILQATPDTYYYDAVGLETTAEAFWQALAIDDVIIVQGFEREGQILIESMFYPLDIPEPLWFEGEVRELRAEGQSFFLDDVRITVSDETLYVYGSFTMEAIEFWSTVQEGDQVNIAGWWLDIPEYTVQAVMIELKQDAPYP